jgi:uncharacterized phage protein gp47/JayE
MAFVARAAAPGGMSGRVLNEALQPLGGAVVSVHLPGAADAPIAISAATGADGFFLLPIPGGAGSGRLVLRVTWADLAAEAELPDPFPQALQRAALVVSIGGLGPDKAFADATEIDLSRPFLPFGPQPQPGSTFAFTSAEVFSKPGATVRLHLPRTVGPQDVTPPEGARVMPHLLAWEYWNGRSWAPLGPSGSQAGQSPDFVCSEVVDIVVPDDMEPVKLNDVEARWMRVRIVSGGYGYVQEIRWDAGREITNSFNVTVVRPPALASASMGYTWQYGPFRPDCVLTENDMAFADRTEETTWPGQSFQPFTPSADPSPSLYLGFDAKLPLDAVSVFLDLVEDRRDPVGPALWWEFWDGFSWRRLSTDDETGRLRVPGIVSFLSAASSEPLARFGTPLHWVRARLQDSGDPGEPRLLGVYPNAVWAVERRTYRDLAIGASEGTPGQSFVIPQVPVLVGEEIEVRESTGARARTEWRLIARQLAGIDEVAIALIEDALNRASPDPDVVYPPLRLRRNAKREVAEVWVRWTSVTNLLGARPSDRVYTLDRPTGRLFFGDGHRGRIPPLDGAILARSFQTGGGSRGNLPAKAISQLLGAIAGAEEVYNLKSSEGGSDGESIAAFRRRGPMAVAHRGRAVTGRDIEALAREASAAVALARAIPLLSANGRHVPGRLTLVIVPASAEARPYPTRGLRERVHAFIAERASATLGGPEAITVVGPEYQGVDVAATLVPHRFSEAGQVERVARAAVLGFLHPLTGGPDGQGWDLGRGVYLSDLAAILDRVPGLDAAFDIALLAGGVPQGEAVAMAPERIAAAGTISLYLLGREA